MKTKEEINQEINSLMQSDKSEMSDAQISRLNNRIAFLRTCLLYLESQPRQDYVESEKSRLEIIVKNIKANYEKWLKNTPSITYGDDVMKAKSVYNKLMNLSNHERHLDNINYILS